MPSEELRAQPLVFEGFSQVHLPPPHESQGKLENVRCRSGIVRPAPTSLMPCQGGLLLRSRYGDSEIVIISAVRRVLRGGRDDEMPFDRRFIERIGLEREDVLRCLAFGQELDGSHAVAAHGFEQVERAPAARVKP